MHNSPSSRMLREDLGGAYVDMQEIVGGMDRLPNAFYGELQDEVRFGAEVFAIDQDPDSVTVHFQTEAGRFSERGDYAVCTIPFSVLRPIEMLDALLARQAARHPPAQLPRVDQDPVPGPRPLLGGGGRHRRRRDRHGPADPPHELPDAGPGRPRAACCCAATPGARTRSSGARWTRRRGSRRRSTTSPAIHPRIRDEFEVRRLARLVQRPVGARRVRAVRAGAADGAPGRHRAARRAGSTSPASTARCTTPGSRGRSNRGSAPRRRSTRRRPAKSEARPLPFGGPDWLGQVSGPDPARAAWRVAAR